MVFESKEKKGIRQLLSISFYIFNVIVFFFNFMYEGKKHLIPQIYIILKVFTLVVIINVLYICP